MAISERKKGSVENKSLTNTIKRCDGSCLYESKYEPIEVSKSSDTQEMLYF